MCYLQLSLWHVPAVVVVGNTLAHEAREVFYTPAHYLGLWDSKLRRRAEGEETQQETQQASSAVVSEAVSPVATASISPKAELARSPAPGGSVQFDFGF